MTYYFRKNFNEGLDKIFKTFFYDVEYSNENTQQEKRKHNFSTRYWQHIKKDGKDILVYDVSGIDPSKIKVRKVVEDGINYIVVESEDGTKNEILDIEMNIKARWAITYQQFKKPIKKIENGFLYVFIEPEKIEEDIEEI